MRRVEIDHQAGLYCEDATDDGRLAAAVRRVWAGIDPETRAELAKRWREGRATGPAAFIYAVNRRPLPQAGAVEISAEALVDAGGLDAVVRRAMTETMTRAQGVMGSIAAAIG